MKGNAAAPVAFTAEGILFDLDGTLVDTAGDIALALNGALAEIGTSPVSLEVVRTLIGRGAPSLIARSLERNGVATDAEGRDRLHDRFLLHYRELQAQGRSVATAYPGAEDALRSLRARGLKVAVVTNKDHALAVNTLAAAGLAGYVDLTLGGDSVARRKPAPDPLLQACRECSIAVPRALMVGDSVNDVMAARAAGIAVWCVPYGYNEGEDPRALPCDRFVESLAELPALLGGGAPLAPSAQGRIPASRGS